LTTNLLERSLEEVRRRTKVIGRCPGGDLVSDDGLHGHGARHRQGSRPGADALPDRHPIAALIAARAVPGTAQQIA